jgi:acyl-CoA oxidase
MFYMAVDNLADDEQRAKWLPLTNKSVILGTYAQTELGHGSNVAGLETTATYDEKTEEFVINSPTITSTKWWPGEMGLTSNHAVLYARLIIGQKDYGVQPFMIQIRSLKDHLPMPGCSMGDIGPKFGYHSKNNGYLRFENVRIPRTNILSKYVEVEKGGAFKVKGDLRVLYSVMLFIRVQLVEASGDYLASAITIAARYAVTRRQFSNQEGTKEERKLMDYQTHMFKIIPLLSYAVAFKFVSAEVRTMH